MSDPQETNAPAEFDYIIVGSGAGGAPLAARLARAGKRVLVIEAGTNHTQRGPRDGGNEVSRVPLLHGASTEHPDLSWRFFVDHYPRNGAGQLPDGIDEDPKWHTPDAQQGEDDSHKGIFYPRAAGIGGCTIHNAMITIAGPESDWDDLADFLQDPSWDGRQMRAYFRKLEHNDHLRAPDRRRRRKKRHLWLYLWNSVLFLFGRRPDATGGRHGFRGWLHTSFTDLSIGLRDRQLVKMLKAALWVSKKEGLDSAWSWTRTVLKGRVGRSLDPNHWETQSDSPEGVVLIPTSVYGGASTIHQNRSTPYAMLGRRSSPRELLLETIAEHGDKLTIWTDCLVTKVILEGDPKRAVGVELLRGERLYRAHVHPNDQPGQPDAVRVSEGGEVILCGGAFNTPQLLMLSGIGDPEMLKDIGDPRHPGQEKQSVECMVPLPGVGKNLQDRYEVSIVSQMKKDFSLLDGATFNVPADPDATDRHLRQWRDEGTGLYTSNGAVLGIFKRSRPDLPKPDLFIFGIPSEFRGYQLGYSQISDHDRFTWVILKSHTRNREGVVRLRSVDPRDTPKINFNYFGTGLEPQAGSSSADPDVKSIAYGVEFVRKILRSARSVVEHEIHPGPQFSSEATVNDWIRRDAWGHHACGTCRMGPDGDAGAVLDSRFRVRGVAGLRVVDASIFPKIPGYFIVSNIYMASEKAADVILADATCGQQQDSDHYPLELHKKEAEVIRRRREQTEFVAAAESTAEPTSDEVNSEAATVGFGPPLGPQGQWNSDVTGLALSGGGIRSATHALGVLQSLARKRLLRRVDLMSTVSGGGYIGSFLGRCFDRLRPESVLRSGGLQSTPPTDQVEQTLSDSQSPPLQWLRSHGNYIAPNGPGAVRLNLAVFVRNLISLHLVVGLAIVTLFSLANVIRYGGLDTTLGLTGLLDLGEMPIGNLVQSLIGPWFSPWFILVELLLLFLVFPRIIAYWIVSQDKHESFKFVPMLILFSVAGVLLLIGVKDGLRFEPVLLGLAMFSSLGQVELAWWRGHQREAATGSGGVETQRLRTRNYLTYDLGLALALTGAALAFALIDTLGHGLQEWKLQANFTYTKAFASLGAGIMAIVPLARWLASFFREQGASGPPSTLKRILLRDMTAGLLAVVLFTLPLVAYSFTSHALFQGGLTFWTGVLVTLGTLALTILLAFPSTLTFVNRSSLSQTYSARLARAYLGASNPARHRPEGINVTEVIAGDDVASIRDYRPHEAGGPLHLINVTINQTVDFGSRLRKRDRQGVNMAVSSLAVSVGEHWHGAWTDASHAGQSGARKVPTGLDPIARQPGRPHPLADQMDRAADRAEMLSLRQWIGISGAAIDPGRGRTTHLGTALLMGLLNMRTGHWWDSGIAAADRIGWPKLSPLRRFLYLIPRCFQTQALLISEWIARYPGPWERFWHISDGGYFENLAAYELVRRRVPRIILCDGGADPSYEFEDFAELVRKVRIDFGARIESLTEADLDALVAGGVLPQPTREHLGSVKQLYPSIGSGGNPSGPSQTHAALCWIHYPGHPPATRSLLLYVKSSLTGDEPDDVRNYHQTHPEFPHESTGDQSFDEAQWESYRKLGEHVGSALFDSDWFWNVPLPPSDGRPA
ncbi:GMC oxidoreductase [Rhodopirellula sp. JC639]|uniref:GMC oxidoreductase n=1 Tax=Stieleria mannarensis TaxID=2755585 RepID=UPI001602CEC6|nr:GMC oxidoreductase [Rhodopirellula sp. JC639]